LFWADLRFVVVLRWNIPDERKTHREKQQEKGDKKEKLSGGHCTGKTKARRSGQEPGKFVRKKEKKSNVRKRNRKKAYTSQ